MLKSGVGSGRSKEVVRRNVPHMACVESTTAERSQMIALGTSKEQFKSGVFRRMKNCLLDVVDQVCRFICGNFVKQFKMHSSLMAHGWNVVHNFQIRAVDFQGVYI